jgi:spore germination protein YaaH
MANKRGEVTPEDRRLATVAIRDMVERLKPDRGSLSIAVNAAGSVTLFWRSDNQAHTAQGDDLDQAFIKAGQRGLDGKAN